MIMHMFTVFDGAVKAYLPPFFARSTGEAIRSFADAVNNREHQFYKHHGDYSLWYLGEFDDSCAGFNNLGVERIVGAWEVIVVDDVIPPKSQEGPLSKMYREGNERRAEREAKVAE